MRPGRRPSQAAWARLAALSGAVRGPEPDGRSRQAPAGAGLRIPAALWGAVQRLELPAGPRQAAPFPAQGVRVAQHLRASLWVVHDLAGLGKLHALRTRPRPGAWPVRPCGHVCALMGWGAECAGAVCSEQPRLVGLLVEAETKSGRCRAHLPQHSPHALAAPGCLPDSCAQDHGHGQRLHSRPQPGRVPPALQGPAVHSLGRAGQVGRVGATPAARGIVAPPVRVPGRQPVRILPGLHADASPPRTRPSPAPSRQRTCMLLTGAAQTAVSPACSAHAHLQASILPASLVSLQVPVGCLPPGRLAAVSRRPPALQLVLVHGGVPQPPGLGPGDRGRAASQRSA